MFIRKLGWDERKRGTERERERERRERKREREEREKDRRTEVIGKSNRRIQTHFHKICAIFIAF